MTRLRQKPKGYLTFIVQPTGSFEPSNWKRTPQGYRIVEFAGHAESLGQADSWKFLHNQAVLRQGKPDRWAIHIAIESPSPDNLQRALAGLRASGQSDLLQPNSLQPNSLPPSNTLPSTPHLGDHRTDGMTSTIR